MSNQQFIESLKVFDMHSNQNDDGGLFFIEDLENTDNYYIKNGLIEAEKYKANAVFFHKGENTPPKVQAYIYHFKKINNEKEIREIHKNLWNTGKVPIFYIFTPDRVDIYNSFSVDKIDKEANIIDKPLESISLKETLSIANIYEQKIKAFSATALRNGEIWENDNYSNKFSESKSIYLKLLNELKSSFNYIIDKKILSEKTAKKIFIICILIKYLEEREDKNGYSVFPKAKEERDGKMYKESFFHSFLEGATSFTEILSSSSAFLELIDNLHEHFKGQLFELENEQKEELRNANLSALSIFLKGTSENAQYSIWRLYQFNHIPIELISEIYGSFLSKKDGKKNIKNGAVYTPPYLVDFLVDMCMPLPTNKTEAEEINLQYKILDPSCGSGVFLVSAYKRLIEWYKIKHSSKSPNLEQLSSLLVDNIYGVDINAEAVELALFSLTLALLDNLAPKAIWEDLEFPNLKDENLFQKDFFELIVRYYYDKETLFPFSPSYKKLFKENFQLVIGNPPFMSYNKMDDKIYAEKLADKIVFGSNRYKDMIHRNQSALLFLSESFQFIQKEDSEISKKGNICLLMPTADLLMREDSNKYRKFLLDNYGISQIIDFTPLRRVLFSQHGDTTIGVCAVFADHEVKEDIAQVIIRRTKASKEKMYFEIDKYDVNIVDTHTALNNTFVWKTNYFNGFRLFDLVNRIEQSKVTLSEYVEDKNILISNYPEVDTTYKYGLKIKANISLENYLYSINSYQHEKGDWLFLYSNNNSELLYIKDYIEQNKTLLRAYLSCNNARSLMGKSYSILDKGIMKTIPMILSENTLKSFYEGVDKIVLNDIDNYLDFLRFGEKSSMLKKVDKSLLENYALGVIQSLSNIYNEIQKDYFFNNYKHNSYVVLVFFLAPPSEETKNTIKEILKETDIFELVKNLVEDINSSYVFKKILKIFYKEAFILIKPNQKRYWLPTVALRDSDEVFQYIS